MGIQELFEVQKFIVLGYHDPRELSEDRARGIVYGHTVDGLMADDAILKVTGEASYEEWAAQCQRCDEPTRYFGEAAHIGFLKVVAE